MGYLNSQHGLIAGHNGFCLSGNRALENPIIRIVIEYAHAFLRLYKFGKPCQEKRCTTQGISITAELRARVVRSSSRMGLEISNVSWLSKMRCIARSAEEPGRMNAET